MPSSCSFHNASHYRCSALFYGIFAVLKIPPCSVSRKPRFRFCLLLPSLIRTRSLSSALFYGIFAVLKIPPCSVSRKPRFRFCLLLPSLIQTRSLRSALFYGIFAVLKILFARCCRSFVVMLRITIARIKRRCVSKVLHLRHSSLCSQRRKKKGTF